MPPLGQQIENIGKVCHIATATQELYIKMLSTERSLFACSVPFSQKALLS